MSTVCKLIVASSDLPAIEAIVRTHMARAGTVTVEDAEWPVTDSESFRNGDDEPDVFSLQAGEHYAELYFNSFCRNETLARTLSAELGTEVLVLIYQSTAEACRWGYYRDGRARRILESGDGELLASEGEPFDFERESGGCDDESEHVFDADDMEDYNRRLGLDVRLYQEPLPGWRILRRERNHASQTGQSDRPWWKLW